MKAREIEASEYLDDSEYDEFLDEIYGPIMVGNMAFCASRILSELDPIAYRCGFADWADTMPHKWQCSECDEEYDSEEEAEECCKEEEEEEEESED